MRSQVRVRYDGVWPIAPGTPEDRMFGWFFNTGGAREKERARVGAE